MYGQGMAFYLRAPFRNKVSTAHMHMVIRGACSSGTTHLITELKYLQLPRAKACKIDKTP